MIRPPGRPSSNPKATPVLPFGFVIERMSSSELAVCWMLCARSSISETLCVKPLILLACCARLLMAEEERLAAAFAISAIEPLVWLLSYHLTALSETENDSSYKEKIIKILDVLFDGIESDFIVRIRNKASE